MKQSIILLELIFVIVLLSIIFATTTKFLFAISDKNRRNYTINLTKIDFETTKIFLTNKLHKDTNLNLVSWTNNQLFYDGKLLQNKVTKYDTIENNGIWTINICIKLHNNICQQWIIR